jgi:hypothetical protein
LGPGTRITDIAPLLGDQVTLFKAMASVPTAWRALKQADAHAAGRRWPPARECPALGPV